MESLKRSIPSAQSGEERVWMRSNVSTMGVLTLEKLLGPPPANCDDALRICDTEYGISQIFFSYGIVRHDMRDILRIRRCRRGESTRHDTTGETVFVVEYIHECLTMPDPYEFVGSLRAETFTLSVDASVDSPTLALECATVFIDKIGDDPESMIGLTGNIIERCVMCGVTMEQVRQKFNVDEQKIKGKRPKLEHSESESESQVLMATGRHDRCAGLIITAFESAYRLFDTDRCTKTHEFY